MALRSGLASLGTRPVYRTGLLPTLFALMLFALMLAVTAPAQAAKQPAQDLIGQVYSYTCLLYTSDAADDTQCVDLGGRRVLKKTPQRRQHHNAAPMSIVP